jgi:hypothetical protein
MIKSAGEILSCNPIIDATISNPGSKRARQKRNNPKRQNETQGQDKDWRRVFEEINAVVRDNNGKSPNRD